MACPYFDCPGSQAMPAVRGAGLCECARANPVRVCASCGVKSQGGARFCRACRTEFRSAAAAPRAVSHSGFVLVPGNFYAPPVFWGGFAWCLAADGSVFRVALEAGSPPVQWASIPSANAGFGPPALVEIEDPKSAVRGPVLIAADDRAVYAVSLANRGVTKLHDTGASGGIRVNTSASESVRYRAIAATPEGFAFVGPAGAADSLLTIRAFNSGQAGRVVPLRGKDFAGPIAAGGKFCVASAEEVTLCAAHEGYRASVALPAGFRPFLERPDAPNLAPGAIPLILTRQGVICLAGNMRQSPGVMALEVSTGRHNFREAPPGGSITVFSPEEMAINHGNRVDFLGLERPAGRIGALASAMPLGRGRMWTSYFAAEGGGRLTVLGSIPFDIDLADAACHADSCCGVTEPAGGSLVVSYFSRGGSNAGLKFAVYRLENGGEDS